MLFHLLIPPSLLMFLFLHGIPFQLLLMFLLMYYQNFPAVSGVTPSGSFDNTSAKTLTVTGTGFHGGTGTSTVTAVSVNGTALTLPGAGSITSTEIPGL